MANAFRSTGQWRNSMMEGASGLNSPLASGFMSKGIGSGNRQAMEDQGRASKFLDDYVSTFDAVGQGYNQMAAAAGAQGIGALASHKSFEAQKSAMEAGNSANALSGGMGILGSVVGLFL